MFTTFRTALQKYVIDGILEDDGATGDQYGPYDPETIKEERQRLKQRKVTTSCMRMLWPRLHALVLQARS